MLSSIIGIPSKTTVNNVLNINKPSNTEKIEGMTTGNKYLNIDRSKGDDPVVCDLADWRSLEFICQRKQVDLQEEKIRNWVYHIILSHSQKTSKWYWLKFCIKSNQIPTLPRTPPQVI